MAGFESRLNDWLVPAALGAVLYFLQALAHDTQLMSQNMAVALRRLDEYERRITDLEQDGRAARPFPH